MIKKPTFLKRVLQFSRQNPLRVFGMLYITLMPAIGSVLFISLLLQYHQTLQKIIILQVPESLIFIAFGTLSMGFAWIPTTLFTAATGFIFGWKALPFLLIAYLSANIFGYILGKKIDADFLEMIKKIYPKFHQLLNQKSEKLGSLIFFVRISPIIPFALSNLIFAILKTGLKKVMIYGSIGMLPRTILSFLTGTLASDIYDIIQDNKGFDNGKLMVVALLMISIWGILRFFKVKEGQNT